MRVLNVTASDDGAPVSIPFGSIMYVRAAPGSGSMIRLNGGECLNVQEQRAAIAAALESPSPEMEYVRSALAEIGPIQVRGEYAGPTLTEDGIPAHSPVAKAIAESRAVAKARAAEAGEPAAAV